MESGFTEIVKPSVCVCSLWGPSLSLGCQMEVDLGSDRSWGRWWGHSAVASVSLCTFACCFCPLDLLSVHSPLPFNTTHPSTPSSLEITVATLYMARAEGPWGMLSGAMTTSFLESARLFVWCKSNNPERKTRNVCTGKMSGQFLTHSLNGQSIISERKNYVNFLMCIFSPCNMNKLTFHKYFLDRTARQHHSILQFGMLILA